MPAGGDTLPYLTNSDIITSIFTYILDEVFDVHPTYCLCCHYTDDCRGPRRRGLGRWSAPTRGPAPRSHSYGIQGAGRLVLPLRGPVVLVPHPAALPHVRAAAAILPPASRLSATKISCASRSEHRAYGRETGSCSHGRRLQSSIGPLPYSRLEFGCSRVFSLIGTRPPSTRKNALPSSSMVMCLASS